MSMRFVVGLFTLLLAILPFGEGAFAAPEGKRVALLGKAHIETMVAAKAATGRSAPVTSSTRCQRSEIRIDEINWGLEAISACRRALGAP